MRYIFIFNGREDKAFVIDEVNRQIEEAGIKADRYVTAETGDATRYVNIFCDLNPKEEVCFVACGGAGLTQEVVSGIVGRENKYLAILAYACTHDFIKVFPDHNFQSVKALVNGNVKEVDIIKVNDTYTLNCASLGMDALVCALAQIYSSNGEKDSYNKGIKSAFLSHRLHKCDFTVDGKKLKIHKFQNGQVSNGLYTGGEFLCAPNAKVDDGLMDVCIFKLMPASVFLNILRYFRKGEHLTNKFCKAFLVSFRAKHIEIRSKDLIYVGLDGEYFAASYIDIDLLPKAVKLILPKKQD